MRNCLFPLAVVVAVWVCGFGIVVLAFRAVFRALGYSDHAHTLGVAFTPKGGSDKGTSVRHRIAAARAIFPSASVNGWARLFALTPFVPLSREAGEGDYGVRKRSFRPR
jgi:hypothetical protein